MVNISEIGRILSSFINGRFSLILTNNISSKEEGEKIAKVCGATCSYININHGERRERGSTKVRGERIWVRTTNVLHCLLRVAVAKETSCHQQRSAVEMCKVYEQENR